MAFFTFAGSPLAKGTFQIGDNKLKLEQLSLKEKEPPLPDISPKIELSSKKELDEPMEEVEGDVQSKQVVADVEKDDMMEQLSAENKHLLLLNKLEERVAEKDQQIAEAEKQITEKDGEIPADDN